MIGKLLENCTCVFEYETEDKNAASLRLSGIRSAVFMPAVTADLWPVYRLECTEDASLLKEKHVWLIPAGAHQGWALKPLEELIRDFYERDEVPDGDDLYGAQLEEMILLHGGGLPDGQFGGDLAPCSLILAEITMQGRQVTLLIAPCTPEECWEGIVDRWGLRVPVLVDSHKGLGDWLTEVPLYDCLKKSGFPEYCLKGVYTSCSAPEPYTCFRSVPAPKKSAGECGIYRKKDADSC